MIKPQHTLHEHARSHSAVLRTGVLSRIMADPPAAGHKDHTRRAVSRSVDGIVAGTADHLARQTPVSQDRGGGLANSLDARIMKPNGWRHAVRLPGDGQLQTARALESGKGVKIRLEMPLELVDDAVRTGSNVQRESDSAGDRVHTARREGQDAGGCERAVVGGGVVGEGYHPRRGEEGVGSGVEGGGAGVCLWHGVLDDD